MDIQRLLVSLPEFRRGVMPQLQQIAQQRRNGGREQVALFIHVGFVPVAGHTKGGQIFFDIFRPAQIVAGARRQFFIMQIGGGELQSPPRGILPVRVTNHLRFVLSRCFQA